MELISIWERRNKVVRQILFGALMLLISVYIVIGGLRNGEIVYTVVGMLGVLLFSASFIFVLRGLFVRRPLMTLSDDGINDTSTMYSVGLVRWEEIESVTLVRRFRQTFVDIAVRDEDTIVRRQSPLRQLMLKFSTDPKRPLVSIPLGTAELSVDEVRDLLEKQLAAHGRKLMLEGG